MFLIKLTHKNIKSLYHPLGTKHLIIVTSALPMGFLPDSHPHRQMINYIMIKFGAHLPLDKLKLFVFVNPYEILYNS